MIIEDKERLLKIHKNIEPIMNDKIMWGNKLLNMLISIALDKYVQENIDKVISFERLLLFVGYNNLLKIYLNIKPKKSLIIGNHLRASTETEAINMIENQWNDDYEYFKGVVSSVINRVNKLRVIDKEALKRTYFEEQDSTINANVLIEKTKNKISKYITDTKNKEEVLGLIERVEENYNSVKDIVLKSSGAGLAYSLVMHEIEKMISSLEQSVKDKDYEELFEISKALSSAIDNITSLLSNDKVKLISVFDILNKAFYFFKRRFKKHEIEIIKNFENKEYVINCLNSLSVNAIMNIMDNSIYWLGYWQKDMKSHGKIYVDILEKEDFIDVIIADNGKGFYISEDIAKLPFKTTKDENLGKGLGLYFVNEIMKQNDGYFKIITNKSFKKEELKIPDEFLNGATIILQFRKA